MQNLHFQLQLPNQFQKLYGFYNYTEVDEIYALIWIYISSLKLKSQFLFWYCSYNIKNEKLMSSMPASIVWFWTC
jgi:hypothetical protein